MSVLVDLHCHYLPGVDDGAATEEQALQLLRAACAEGIGRIVLTPHIHLDRYPNVQSLLQKRFRHFAARVSEEKIPVQLRLGGEVRLHADVMVLVEREEIPLLHAADGRKILLLEFPHQQLTPGWQQLVRWLLRRNITPLIAHPERNKEVMRDAKKAGEMVREGCLLQLTAAAVSGGFGANAQAAARELLKNDWVTVLATDAHNLAHRPPVLRKGVEAAALLIGESKAWDMVTTVPAALAFSSTELAVSN